MTRRTPTGVAGPDQSAEPQRAGEYSSSSVRHSIDDLLAPLATLGKNKQKEYATTLRVYLENNRSVSRTSQQLYLHRNTVAYRIRRILDVLDVDLDDPNQFLAVYLACYASSMPHGPGSPQRPGTSRQHPPARDPSGN